MNLINKFYEYYTKYILSSESSIILNEVEKTGIIYNINYQNYLKEFINNANEYNLGLKAKLLLEKLNNLLKDNYEKEEYIENINNIKKINNDTNFYQSTIEYQQRFPNKNITNKEQIEEELKQSRKQDYIVLSTILSKNVPVETIENICKSKYTISSLNYILDDMPELLNNPNSNNLMHIIITCKEALIKASNRKILNIFFDTEISLSDGINEYIFNFSYDELKDQKKYNEEEDINQLKNHLNDTKNKIGTNKQLVKEFKK